MSDRAVAAGETDGPAVRPNDTSYPQKLREFMRTAWADATLDVVPRPEVGNHARRRAALHAAFPGEALVIPTGLATVRANDTYHGFRPGSDFAWLTGDHDPGSVLIIHPDGEATLFVRPRSRRDNDEFFRDSAHGELWVGRRHTLAEKAIELGVGTADLKDLPAALAGLAPGRTRVLRGHDPAVDAAVLPYEPRRPERLGTDPRRPDSRPTTSATGPTTSATGPERSDNDPKRSDTSPKGPGADPEARQPAQALPTRDAELAQYLGEARLVKDEWEVAQLQHAIDATVRGFEDVARMLPADRPVSERLIEGVFGLRARVEGNGVGYGSIVGAGRHATVLHWSDNTGSGAPGELLLMDMGVEGRNLYTADVTRTLPFSGRFSPEQRDIYQIVFEAANAGLAAIAPGVKFEEVAVACNRVLAQGLHELGLLPCTPDEALDKENMAYRRWTLHGFGHMLGLDVHDCANARGERYREGELGENYVLTMEPGLYFQPEDELVPEQLRGIGIRIEDDVLVTASGCRVLSAGLPRAIDEVETWLAAQRDLGPRLPD